MYITFIVQEIEKTEQNNKQHALQIFPVFFGMYIVYYGSVMYMYINSSISMICLVRLNFFYSLLLKQMAGTIGLNEEWQRNSLELKDINSLIFSFMYTDDGCILF